MLLDKILDPPSYGWTDSKGGFSKPGSKQIISEFFNGSISFIAERTGYPFLAG
ncbi:stearoyl-CoA desaturase (delta-9 desaturase) [bacterium A37T11]|nr:stearoyl-CoA desaturase (delta-9 desaturase) [bacterium A37T11]